MANTIIAYDDLDSSLGQFFTACKQELESFFSGQGIAADWISSNRLNDLAISATTAKFEYFVFGAYSHGDHNSLLKSARDPYITIVLNGDSFKNCFFYTFSCKTGLTLGLELIGKKCLCFIGYQKDVFIWNTYIKPFVECANYGLIQFFNGNNTEEVMSKMVEKYNENIDATYKINFLIAAILRDNRDALIRHGDVISIQDLN